MVRFSRFAGAAGVSAAALAATLPFGAAAWAAAGLLVLAIG